MNTYAQPHPLDIPFVHEMAKITLCMWRSGWDERNGGNISCILDEQEVARYLDITGIQRTLEPAFPVTELAGMYLSLPARANILKM